MQSSNNSSTPSSSVPLDHETRTSNKAAQAQEKLREGWSSIQAAALLAKEHVEEKLPKSLKKKFLKKEATETPTVVYFDEMEPGRSQPSSHAAGVSHPPAGVSHAEGGSHSAGAFSYEHGRVQPSSSYDSGRQSSTDEGVPFSSVDSSSSYSGRAQPASYDSSRAKPSAYDSGIVQALPVDRVQPSTYDSSRPYDSSSRSYDTSRMQPSSCDSSRVQPSSYDSSRGQSSSGYDSNQVQRPDQGKSDGLIHIYNGRVQDVPYEKRPEASHHVASTQASGHGTVDSRKPGMFDRLKNIVLPAGR